MKGLVLDIEDKTIRNFVGKAILAGFRVYVSASGTHGFYTDSEGGRVASFQLNLFGLSLSGNYHGSRASGSGWRMLEDVNVNGANTNYFQTFLHMPAPRWANKNPVYTTEAQHLKMYGKSSGYQQVIPTFKCSGCGRNLEHTITLCTYCGANRDLATYPVGEVIQ